MQIDPPKTTSPCSVPPLDGSRQFDFHPAILRGVTFQWMTKQVISGHLREQFQGKKKMWVLSAMKWNFLSVRLAQPTGSLWMCLWQLTGWAIAKKSTFRPQGTNQEGESASTAFRIDWLGELRVESISRQLSLCLLMASAYPNSWRWRYEQEMTESKEQGSLWRICLGASSGTPSMNFMASHSIPI